VVGVTTDALVPDTVDAEARDLATHALALAPDTEHTLALVSGGHDSLTAMHVAYRSDAVSLDGVVHIDTGIGVPDTREFVQKRARQLDLDYYEVGSEYRYASEEYRALVRQYGFPGPGAHKWMYVNLKEKPLQRFLSTVEGDVTLVSGVRRHESDRRMENVVLDGVQDYLGCTTISPLVGFTGLDVRRYRRALDLPMNPVVEMLEMSGECLCGSFANRGEKRMLRLFYPDVYRRLLCLEAMVAAAAHLDDGPDEAYTDWGHNRLKDREQHAMADDEQMLLCESCERDCDGSGDGCE
jgi:phosphoadenosine phosphosulfate reductase